MACFQVTDFTETFSKLFSRGECEEFSSESFLYESDHHQVLRYVILSLLSEQYPIVKKPIVDLQTMKKTKFDEALVSLLMRDDVTYDGLTYLEKLIVCNLSFIYDLVDEERVWKLTTSLSKTFSQKQKIMTYFLLQEEEARTQAFILLGYTLIDVALRSGLIMESQSIKERYYDTIEGVDKCFDTDISILAETIYLVTRNLPCHARPFENKDPCQSLNSFQADGFDLLFSFTGTNRGVGSIAFDQVRIVSFGPQVEDLGQVESYGITFKTSDTTHIQLKEEEDSYACRGWSRLHGDKDTWVEHDFRYRQNVFDMFVSFESFHNVEKSILESFFVCADEVRVDGRIVKKGSLNRYQAIARKVELVCGDEVVVISLKSDVMCQVVPLAGGEFYWSANFIISFEPESITSRLHLQFVRG